MKALRYILILALGALAYGQTRPASFTITATAQCATIKASDNSVVGIVATGTWSGTLSPTLKIYGATTGVAKKVTPVDGSAQATITANGAYTAAVGGFTEFDLCSTGTWTSGTATVQLYATPAVNVGVLGGGTPGGAAGGSLAGSYPNPTIASGVALPGSPTTTTQAQNDNSTNVATTSYTDLAVANGIAGVNPAVAVQAATAAVLPNSPTYLNGVAGVGATLTTATLNAALVVDGYTPLLNDRILVKNQASAFQNGVYTVTQLAGVGLAWILTRAGDSNKPSDMNNTGAIPVVNGTANAQTQWLQTSTVTTVGTDAVTYTQFSVSPTGPTCLWTTFPTTGGTGNTLSATTNKATLWKVGLAAPCVSTAVTYDIGTADNTANTYDLGLYTSAGVLSAHTGSTAGTTFASALGIKDAAWTGSVNLAAGTYYIALTSSCTSTCATLAGASTNAIARETNTTVSVTAGGTLSTPITPPADSSSGGAQIPALIVR